MISFRHIPIRLRLSLWYTLLTALVLVIFSFALYIGLERQLSTTLDQDLRNQAALASTSITYAGGLRDPRSRVSQTTLPTWLLLWVVNFDTSEGSESPGRDACDLSHSWKIHLARGRLACDLTARSELVNSQDSE